MTIRRSIIGILIVILVGILIVASVIDHKDDSTENESLSSNILADNAIASPVKDPSTEVTIIPTINQTEILEHPEFVKEIYIPIIPEGNNIGLDGDIEASSFNQSFTPRKAIDGNTAGASYWEGEPDTYPNALELNLLKLSSVHAIKVRLNPANIWGKRTQTFEVQVSVDGENYEILADEKVYTFDPDYGNEVLIEFESISVQYVKLIFTDNTGADGAQVAELEVYGGLEK